MSGVQRIIALGAFIIGLANAQQGPQQVVRSDPKTGQKHVGCYYGVWAYTRPGLGEFWPEDIDVSLCDVIYYGFGNVLNHTYEVCSWDPCLEGQKPQFEGSLFYRRMDCWWLDLL